MINMREFIVKNYFGLKIRKLPFTKFYISYLRAAPKLFSTLLVYGILKTAQVSNVGYTNICWWDMIFIGMFIIQLSWSFSFFGLTYNDNHPITEEEKKKFFKEGEI